MSYESISIRQALNRVNQSPGGWFLPQVQRQYVWGARDESEDYICLLMDSILRKYPIGGIVLWETETPIPHREFLTDYANGARAKEVDSGLWTRRKLLVYDGQQRLQTLFSVLKHTINGRIMCFDLLFDKVNSETDETGFYFADKGAALKSGSIRMNFLFAQDDDASAKENLKDQYSKEKIYTNEQSLLIKSNLDNLWSIFVQEDAKPLAFYSVNSKSDREVNEVFRRLNTGGIPLTQIELVLSTIKRKHSSFEESLDLLKDEIYAVSSIEFSSAEILQLLFIMIKGTTRVDSERINESDADAFKEKLALISVPLKDYFSGYLLGLFNINDRSIIPRGLAMMPIMVFLADKYELHGIEIKRISADSIKFIHQYFLLSQFNDWNTQTMISSFVKEARLAAKLNNDFPLEKIKQIAKEKNRVVELRKQTFMSYRWFALKVLTPSRKFHFTSTKPQIDHIFPTNLSGQDQAYKSTVDVLWNFQPMPATINNYKRAKHPFDFLTSEDGKKYLEDYDYLPSLESDVWQSAVKFIANREEKMTEELNSRYGLKFEIV